MKLIIGVITLFPQMFDALKSGVIGRALKQDRLTLSFWNPRDYATDPHRTVDDRPYGGGPGMVMKFEPLALALKAAKAQLGENTKVIHLTPQGKLLTQAIVREKIHASPLILLAGRYEGIDERLIEAEVDEEWSIGDYILSGGELPAMVLIDAMTRLLPGVLGHKDSASQDSFTAGLLDYSHYTRPEKIADRPVPSVLLSGDHEAISRWRLKQSLGRTWQRRQDLIKRRSLSENEQRLLDEFFEESS
ncbi:tRNA (guanosine(37)-N1)-methyltransferase TrmD [Coxiella burnetii]|uniref:tRNA (guanine-N(1)-)-methyltransferase n=1 Tax=Coxiella burnetii (strain CbuG_Q212) TaxID=434923 RepID=TRMD_COXB2|nr:tRNA (guanosine(37)-N1)-methyltransferase TrmD [Coxiella burnetii]B6J1N4.1 RecName: Full=tRNA (guanine-N(1)-)-methyltransferase; AltName: Full=M1G-methyltransferase; AltName: Full=tRNA [GM37] methyltransferase [Coxiella burnetii CbuG_Q212]ACJ18862.1 tRNA (Guanine-N(1)-)-methyltransferase [Coxiella burnetii CbuG_Q212]ATN67229.1 tRNA (guanine-N1)-methyltransferase [Coxiella burnetii]OYK85829.1 tRNA (guanosine(37)-N1)-methyltransferase TrmD [Coxiella burnetii]